MENNGIDTVGLSWVIGDAGGTMMILIKMRGVVIGIEGEHRRVEIVLK